MTLTLSKASNANAKIGYRLIPMMLARVDKSIMFVWSAFVIYQCNTTMPTVPRRSFTRACNMRNSSGTCNSDGRACVSYSMGQSCEECAKWLSIHPPRTNQYVCLAQVLLEAI